MGIKQIPLGSIKGIPILVNLSWFITLVFITSLLAVRFYPEVFDETSRYNGNHALHWAMGIAGALLFFGCILLHELAHSLVALKQGIPVKNITFFVFGGVSQISGEAKRPRNEFVLAVIGPFVSFVIAGALFGVWQLLGGKEHSPVQVVIESLSFMNLTVAVFNMAPGFPMDGGRVLRSILWGITGSMFKATRIATLIGRSLGYTLVFLGFFTLIGLIGFIDPMSGAWMAVLGFFLESSANHSWFNARAIDYLSRYNAEDIMDAELETATTGERIRYLMNRGGRRFIFFVSDEDDQVVGVLTEKQTEALDPDKGLTATAADIMIRTQDMPVVEPKDTGATILERMEFDTLWHMPVVSEGRVIGVVSRENLLRLMARGLIARPGLAS